MKIDVYCWDDAEDLGHDVMMIDGKRKLSVHPLCECPEDAIIGRSLISCTEVAELMKTAFAAGAAGESFDYTVIDG